MHEMFFNCHKLTNLNLLSFDIRNVVDMDFIFSGCDNLKNIKYNEASKEKIMFYFNKK